MKTKYIDMTQDMNVNGKFTDIYSYIKKILFLTVLMIVGATSAWAQTDYSGTYLIGSNGWVSGNNENYYLCPTENWYYYQSASPYYTGTDNGMPFMTTYQCRDGVYNAVNAVWIVEKKGDTDYYYIKHYADGKYLTFNSALGNSSNVGRMRVHLEDSPADDDDALFEINWISDASSYDLKTKKDGEGTKGRKFLNVCGANSASGNFNSLQATNAKVDGPTGVTGRNVGGTVGLWTSGSKVGKSGDLNSMWYLETVSVCETPTITYNESTHEVSMSTATDGATIYYTTDGTEPTSSSTPYTAVFTVSSTTNFKAIAVKAGKINSMTASKQVVKYTYHIVK